MYRSVNGKKISLVSPVLSLGQAVHSTLEYLATLPTERRFSHSLTDDFLGRFQALAGESGGFFDKKTEQHYRERGLAMINQVISNPGPLKQKTVRIKAELPYFWLSETDGLILCGKIDWLAYDEVSDSVKIIDFKTGKKKESPDSLQLPIYHVLATKCQTRSVSGASYWYLASDSSPSDQILPECDTTLEKVLSIGRRIKLQRSLHKLDCPTNGCQACRPYEAIVSGKAKFVGTGTYGQELYALRTSDSEFDSELL